MAFRNSIHPIPPAECGASMLGSLPSRSFRQISDATLANRVVSERSRNFKQLGRKSEISAMQGYPSVTVQPCRSINLVSFEGLHKDSKYNRLATSSSSSHGRGLIAWRRLNAFRTPSSHSDYSMIHRFKRPRHRAHIARGGAPADGL
jgi:hypothetical protein